jgi:hypothetical protein
VPPDPDHHLAAKKLVRPVNRSERRHQIGGQLGGSGYMLFAYRYHLGGGLFFDTGYLNVQGGHNGSIGLVAGLPLGSRWMPYAGLGLSFGHAFGRNESDDCDPAIASCESDWSTFAMTFSYGRAGIALHFGAERRHSVGIDGGFWYGLLHRSDGRRHDSAPFLWPMAGLSYHRTL